MTPKQVIEELRACPRSPLYTAAIEAIETLQSRLDEVLADRSAAREHLQRERDRADAAEQERDKLLRTIAEHVTVREEYYGRLDAIRLKCEHEVTITPYNATAFERGRADFAEAISAMLVERRTPMSDHPKVGWRNDQETPEVRHRHERTD